MNRILHVVSAMDRGGAETLIMNIYRNINRSVIQFDFVTHSDKIGDYDEEIKFLGGRIYRIKSLGTSGPVQYIKSLINIITTTPYNAIHVHTDFQCGFPVLAARLSGVENRICHSHSTNWLKKNGVKEKITFNILQLLIKMNATQLCSCSVEAATFLFGKSPNNNNVKILKNGIDLSDYMKVDCDVRASVLDEFELPTTVKLIGHVGKFSESKNQKFILRVLKRVLEKDPNYVCIFVGDGPLRESIEKEAKQMNLLNHVKFLGVREDIPRLMKSFEIFLFPSLFEGFGIVMLEAQSAGIPCVASTAVPNSVDIGLGLVSFLPLENNLDQWKETILNTASLKKLDPTAIEKQILLKGFHIKDNVSEWLRLYGLEEAEMTSYEVIR